jgi:hypothetical protein
MTTNQVKLSTATYKELLGAIRSIMHDLRHRVVKDQHQRSVLIMNYHYLVITTTLLHDYLIIITKYITTYHQRTGGFTFCTFCTYGALFQGAHPRSQEQVCRLLGPVFLLLFLMYGCINEIRKFACLLVLRQ